MSTSFPALSLPTLSSSSPSSSSPPPQRRTSRNFTLRRRLSTSNTTRNAGRTYIRRRSTNAASIAFFGHAEDIHPTILQHDEHDADLDALVHALTRLRISGTRINRIARVARRLSSPSSSRERNPFMTVPQSSRGLEDIFASLRDVPSSNPALNALVINRLVPTRRYRLPTRQRWTIDLTDRPSSDSDTSSTVSSVDRTPDSDLFIPNRRTGSVSSTSTSTSLTQAFTTLGIRNSLDSIPNSHQDSDSDSSDSDISSISNIAEIPPLDLYPDPDPEDTLRIEHYRSILVSMRYADFLDRVRDEIMTTSSANTSSNGNNTFGNISAAFMSREELAERFANETARLLAENVRLSAPPSFQDSTLSQPLTGTRLPTQVSNIASSHPRFGVPYTVRPRKSVSWADESTSTDTDTDGSSGK